MSWNTDTLVLTAYDVSNNEVGNAKTFSVNVVSCSGTYTESYKADRLAAVFYTPIYDSLFTT